ncbi:hypothetical protein AB0953_00720 [Streptomyces sp. NPDC046866]|uniref:hypothetical protein n=1 Tax=Streptomyces sp. NPDC046866 TaxID=3154921 RepID=UPI0034561254
MSAPTVAATPVPPRRACTDPAEGVTRPLVWVARAAALTLVPSGLWRVAIAFGAPSGFKPGNPLHVDHFPGPTSLYLVGLSLFAECLGLLSLGLVQRWGEVLPQWVPWLGGRSVPPLAAVIPASLGALAVTAITFAGAWTWDAEMSAADAPTGVAAWVMSFCYAPLVLWGPLLAVLTVAYGRRRRRG